MGRIKTGRNSHGKDNSPRPSFFFLAAMSVGFALLVWLFWIAATNPEVHKPPGEKPPVEAPAE